MTYRLYITDKKVSSWSMRPWLLLHELGIPFEEELVPLYLARQADNHFFRFSPAGKVPCLHHSLPDGGDQTAAANAEQRVIVVWDSLAIIEYLAEQHPDKQIWPADATARAFARCVVAEMHAGFPAVRSQLSADFAAAPGTLEIAGLVEGERGEKKRGPELERELKRLRDIFAEGLRRFGGPWLAGAEFGVVDAFYVPVAVRLAAYGVDLGAGDEVRGYLRRLLGLKGVGEWCEAAREEARAQGGVK